METCQVLVTRDWAQPPNLQDLLLVFFGHCLSGSFKFVFKGGGFFYSLTKCSAPFVRRIRGVGGTMASHFYAKADTGRKKFDNFRVSPTPPFPHSPPSLP